MDSLADTRQQTRICGGQQSRDVASRAEQLRHVLDAVRSDRGFQCGSLFAVADHEPLNVVGLVSDSRDRPRGGRVIL